MKDFTHSEGGFWIRSYGETEMDLSLEEQGLLRKIEKMMIQDKGPISMKRLIRCCPGTYPKTIQSLLNRLIEMNRVEVQGGWIFCLEIEFETEQSELLIKNPRTTYEDLKKFRETFKKEIKKKRERFLNSAKISQ
jgi:hypothetical protein